MPGTARSHCTVLRRENQGAAKTGAGGVEARFDGLNASADPKLIDAKKPCWFQAPARRGIPPSHGPASAPPA